MPSHIKRKSKIPSDNTNIFSIITLSVLAIASLVAIFSAFEIYKSNSIFLSKKSQKIKDLNLKTQDITKNFDESLKNLSGWSPLGKGYEKTIKEEQAEKELKTRNGYYSSYAELNENQGVGEVYSYTRRDGTTTYHYSRYPRRRRY